MDRGVLNDFHSLLDKVTNPMQLEPDNGLVEKICDLIDRGALESSYAIQALYGKMTDDNPHTVLFALKVLEKIFYQCGNLAHKVICTKDFMDLLKDIVETTDQKLIRNKILELVQVWTDTFKHFPQYSAPEKLLRDLQAHGYVFPGFENDKSFESSEQHYDNKIAALMCENNVSVCKKILETNDYSNSNDSGIDCDTDMKNRENQFKRSLKEIQEKKKMDFKKYQKSHGLATSSDEEDTGHFVKEIVQEYEENIFKPLALSSELIKIKESRLAVENDLKEYRNSKNKEFQQKNINENDGSNETLFLRKPEDKCSTCEKYKKKCEHENIFERAEPRLHPDLKKVKESRKFMKNILEQCRMEKKEAYYGTKSSDWVDISSHENHVDEYFRKPITRLSEREEQKDLEEALRLSLLETPPNQTMEDDELQRAIDISIAQADDDEFSTFPKLGNNDDDNALLSYVGELSLYEREQKSTDLYAEYDLVKPCIICATETKSLKTFEPCNHKCICDDCSKQYTSQHCPICRQYYASIRF